MPTITASIDGSAVKAQSLAGNRRLQPLRSLHDCSDCFRLERLPGGACTHWKAPPCHGARQQRKSPRSLDHLATIPKDGPVTGSHPSLGTQRFETRVASGSITVPNKVVGPAAAIHTQTQIAGSAHNTQLSRRPPPCNAGSL